MMKVVSCFLLALVAARGVRGDKVSVHSSCVGDSEQIVVSFQKDRDRNFDDNWVAIYFSDAFNHLLFLPEGELWASLCGSQDCGTNPSTGSVTFESEAQSWNQGWPLRPGRYRAVLSRGDAFEDWLILAVSQIFEVGCNDAIDDSADNDNSVEPQPTSIPETHPTPEPSDSVPDSSLNLGMEMLETILEARADIEDLIASNQLLAGKFLRLAFHDCVGGCDGCVDMSNPDNAGLVMPIDLLDPVVEEYEDRGLSRTDIWMLSAVVASDVSETSVGLDFPFQWIGRRTCEDIHGGNDCGRSANGQQSSCTPFGGPHRTLCHGDTAGTRTIEEFMLNEFGFDAQQTAAIMGAHTIGAMRDVNLGFEGRSGWDLTNDELDHGYFVELVGGGNLDAANWVQARHNNNRLGNIPSRWQYEARVNGVQLTMLNSDIAMVLDLVEGENLMSDGRVTCDFSGDNPCERNTPFLPFVTRYANSRAEFLFDYRDALELMIENGYARDTTCDEDKVCLLTSLF